MVIGIDSLCFEADEYGKRRKNRYVDSCLELFLNKKKHTRWEAKKASGLRDVKTISEFGFRCCASTQCGHNLSFLLNEFLHHNCL